MYRKKRFYLVCAFCMFVFAFSQSSAKAQATANINWLDTSEYPSMKSFVSVINTDGKPSVNLTENRFSVYIDGAKLTPDRVEVFAESGEKADIVLLVDNSGSMKPVRDPRPVVPSSQLHCHISWLHGWPATAML